MSVTAFNYKDTIPYRNAWFCMPIETLYLMETLGFASLNHATRNASNLLYAGVRSLYRAHVTHVSMVTVCKSRIIQSLFSASLHQWRNWPSSLSLDPLVCFGRSGCGLATLPYTRAASSSS